MLPKYYSFTKETLPAEGLPFTLAVDVKPGTTIVYASLSPEMRGRYQGGSLYNLHQTLRARA